jgi:peptidoglycan/LPS O-acetylase OafA/YrhL
MNKLDGLRGIASLMVIAYHYHETLLPGYIGYNFVVRSSECFVDLFFVLSGFVISMNYGDRIHEMAGFKDFISKRFIRLYPLLLYSTLIYLAFDMLTSLLLPHLVNTPLTLKQQLLETTDTLIFTNSMPLLGRTEGMNYPSWSISSEMVSYIVFGLLSLSFHGRRGNKVLPPLFIITACSVFCLQQRTYFYAGNFGFVRGLLCFNLGIIVHHLTKYRFRLHNGLEYLLPLAILASFWFLQTFSSEQKHLLALFTVPLLFACTIFVLSCTSGLISRFLETPVLQYLGRISYSVYLNHAIVVLVFPRFVFRILGVPNDNAYLILTFLLSICIVLVYSGLTYRYIELNGAKWMRRAFYGGNMVQTAAGDDVRKRTLSPFPGQTSPARPAAVNEQIVTGDI